jgi:hypothetical protein
MRKMKLSREDYSKISMTAMLSPGRSLPPTRDEPLANISGTWPFL